MSLTPVNAANLGSTPYVNAQRNLSVSFLYAAAFNTPSSSWNTIVIPKVVGGNAGDVIKLSVYKGALPDDPNTDDDNSETSARLDANDLLDSATYTVASNIGTDGISAQFDFNTNFSSANCGAAYTVVGEQFDSSGNHANFSAVFCTDRDGVYNFINNEDEGVEGIGFAGFAGGGVGNVYRQFRYGSTTPEVHTISFDHASITIDGTTVYDPCPAWGIYSRPLGSGVNDILKLSQTHGVVAHRSTGHGHTGTISLASTLKKTSETQSSPVVNIKGIQWALSNEASAVIKRNSKVLYELSTSGRMDLSGIIDNEDNDKDIEIIVNGGNGGTVIVECAKVSGYGPQQHQGADGDLG